MAFHSKKGAYTATSTDDDEFHHVHVEPKASVTDRYLKAEFTAMDTDNDGQLTTKEFTKLLMFLGYGGEDGRTEALLKIINKDDTAVITLDEYYDAMKNHQEVMEKTNMLRELFGRFDDNKDGKAKKSQIEQGFRDMGIDVDNEMKKEIDKMDENHDGKIAYEEFVRRHLRNKEYIS